MEENEPIVGTVNVEQVDATKVERKPIGRLSEEDLQAFVLGCIENKIVTSLHVQANDGDLAMVFLPIAFGGLQHVDTDDLALVWEWFDQANPRAVNGHPSFLSMRLLSKADWARARPVIVAELERRKNLVVP